MLKLTLAQQEAIELAGQQGGYVYAGNNVVRGGLYRVNARTLDALVRKGLAEPRMSSEGGYAVELIEPEKPELPPHEIEPDLVSRPRSVVVSKLKF